MLQEPQPVLHAPAPEQQLEQSQTTVGVFDSGVGGLTVVKALRQRRPDLRLIYFGDSLNLPYGGRSPEQLMRLGQHNIEFLIERGATVLAVGCNTTTSVMGQGGLKSWGLPVFDLVSSTLDWLRTQHARPPRLGLLGTQATINSRYWERRLTDAFPEMKVFAEACPEFVPLLEDSRTTPQDLRYAVHERLRPILDAGVRTILHGCTHYPWLQHFMSELNPDLHFINPADCLAHKLSNSLPPARDAARKAPYVLYSSKPGPVFRRFSEEVLGPEAQQRIRMYIVSPYED